MVTNDKRQLRLPKTEKVEPAKPIVISDVVLSVRELLLEVTAQFLDFQEDSPARSRLLSRLAVVRQTEADNKWSRAIARDRLKASAQTLLDMEEDNAS